MANWKFNKLHQDRIKLLDSGKATFILPDNYQQKSFEELVKMQPGCNKCFTLYDLRLGKIVKWHLVKEIFGYTNEEFTIEAINNASNEIIHKEHIEHKLRYDRIIYSLLASKKVFEILQDNYVLRLRMIHKNGEILPIRRSSYIFEAKEHIPLMQLDIWEKHNRDEDNHVFPDLIVSDQSKSDSTTEEFYHANLAELNLNFTKRALFVLHHKMEGKSNKFIAQKLKIQEQSVANYHSRNFKKLRNAFPCEIDEIIQNNFTQKTTKLKKEVGEHINVFREICKKMGLHPVPKGIREA